LHQAGAGFPRRHRLASGAQFTAVLKQGRSSRDKYFRVFAVPNDLDHPRLGLIVSRRVDTRAVARNRIKRQVRESFRRHCATLRGLDLVVMAQAPAAAVDNPGLRVSLDRHWQEAVNRCKES